MVSFYRFPWGDSCQNASRKLTIRVSSIWGWSYLCAPILRTHLEGILAGLALTWTELRLSAGG